MIIQVASYRGVADKYRWPLIKGWLIIQVPLIKGWLIIQVASHRVWLTIEVASHTGVSNITGDLS